MTLFFYLIFGHALADYPLQGDFLASAKNHTAPVSGVAWEHALFFHALIHAGIVAMFTGSVAVAVAELIAHMVIDYQKCAGRLTFQQDQYLHIFCKFVWAYLLS